MNNKVIICFLSIIALLFSACNNPKNELLGTWTEDVDVPMASGNINYTFEKDGNVTALLTFNASNVDCALKANGQYTFNDKVITMTFSPKDSEFDYFRGNFTTVQPGIEESFKENFKAMMCENALSRKIENVEITNDTLKGISDDTEVVLTKK